MGSKVIIDDGTTRVEVPTSATVDLSIDYTFGGNEVILRTLNGTGIKQSQWYKTNIVINASGRKSPGLDAIDWCVPIGLTLADDACQTSSYYNVYCSFPDENYDHGNQRINWTLRCRLINERVVVP